MYLTDKRGCLYAKKKKVSPKGYLLLYRMISVFKDYVFETCTRCVGAMFALR